MSKAEAAQRLLACAVEAGFGSGNSLAMVMGAKCLVKRVAERQRRWQRRNEARLASANAEAKSKEAMYVTPPFALSAEDKVEEVRTETPGEDAVDEDAERGTSRSQFDDPLAGVEFE